MNTEEFTGRYHDAWLSKRFILPLRHIREEARLILHCRRFPYPEELTIWIYVNGKLVHEEKEPKGEFTITTTIPPLIRGNLEIVASDVFIPKEKRINDDVRKLSFLLDEMIVPGLPDLIEPYLHLFNFSPTRKVFFLDDQVWDDLSFILADNYKVPFKEMLNPLKEQEWWDKIQPSPSSFISGTVYDKFSGAPLEQAEVLVLNREKQPLKIVSIDEKGNYLFDELPSGEYVITAKAEEYGTQEIRVVLGEYGKFIHMPMLPLL